MRFFMSEKVQKLNMLEVNSWLVENPLGDFPLANSRLVILHSKNFTLEHCYPVKNWTGITNSQK